MIWFSICLLFTFVIWFSSNAMVKPNLYLQVFRGEFSCRKLVNFVYRCLFKKLTSHWLINEKIVKSFHLVHQGKLFKGKLAGLNAAEGDYRLIVEIDREFNWVATVCNRSQKLAPPCRSITCLLNNSSLAFSRALDRWPFFLFNDNSNYFGLVLQRSNRNAFKEILIFFQNDGAVHFLVNCHFCCHRN